MAQATVDDMPPQRFYCHQCNVQFSNAADNYTCPHCSNGFIEALEASADFAGGNDSEDELYDVEPDTFMFVHPSRGRRPDPLRHRRRNSGRTVSAAFRPGTFENLIQDFIVNLGVGVNWGPGGNMQVILGNPADYAWGREGLDAIVTQLLNQMDTTGPPPLSKDVIDALPRVEITPEQVDSKLQCSVCWEDFRLGETVCRLPCQHVYHGPCIKPWLELHGTCPICRQNLGEGESGNSEGEPGNDGASGGGGGNGNNSLNALQQLFQVVQSGSNTSASPSGSTSYFHSSPQGPNSSDPSM